MKFGSLTTLKLLGLRLFGSTYDVNHDLFLSLLNSENLVLIDFALTSGEIFKIYTPRLFKCVIRNFDSRASPKLKVCISAPRLKLLDINNMNPLNLEIRQCPTLEKINVRVSTDVTWLDEIDCRIGYIFHLTGDSTKGKFVSYHINSDAALDLNKVTCLHNALVGHICNMFGMLVLS
ncbi:hypothetical protein Dsin_019882 [Dipteronia sinensis]|uniref:Uncharacterized protein n=1 Tax=Dipteronia sinensis TaxID=43782 RepID=A0AAE0A894_9ROSI|nr:hypothetical protein Dsin_019882 [Dipteronia sinensis]